MKYMSGDIWELTDQLRGWAVIPTNTTIRSDGKAVMGAGLAKEAAERFPGLPERLAEHIKIFGEGIYTEMPIVCLPTKHNWRQPSRIEWIEQGCRDLYRFGQLLSSVGHEQPIFLPKLGCGLGGLNWERQVRPLVDTILEGDRFVLVTQ